MIQCHRLLHGRYFDCKLCLIAACNVVALRSRLSTLAFFGAYELLQFTVHLLDLPSHGGLCFDVMRNNRTW